MFTCALTSSIELKVAHYSKKPNMYLDGMAEYIPHFAINGDNW